MRASTVTQHDPHYQPRRGTGHVPFAKNLLVKRPGKVAIEQLFIVNGLGNNATTEPKVLQVIGIDGREMVGHVRLCSNVGLRKEGVTEERNAHNTRVD